MGCALCVRGAIHTDGDRWCQGASPERHAAGENASGSGAVNARTGRSSNRAFCSGLAGAAGLLHLHASYNDVRAQTLACPASRSSLAPSRAAPTAPAGNLPALPAPLGDRLQAAPPAAVTRIQAGPPLRSTPLAAPKRSARAPAVAGGGRGVPPRPRSSGCGAVSCSSSATGASWGSARCSVATGAFSRRSRAPGARRRDGLERAATPTARSSTRRSCHRDPTWDLALLVPAHRSTGRTASPPASSSPARPTCARRSRPRMGAKPIALPVHYKGLTDAISRQGDSLLDALDVDMLQLLPVMGAPILDQQASVVGVLVRACKLAVATGSLQDAAKTGPIACAPTIIRRAGERPPELPRANAMPLALPPRRRHGSGSPASPTRADPGARRCAWSRSRRRACARRRGLKAARREAEGQEPTGSSRWTGSRSTRRRSSGTRSESTRSASR